MFKKRYHSVKSDFKTGFFCKFFLFLGILFLIIFIILKVSAIAIGEGSSGITQQIYDYAQSAGPESILAFSLIFLAVSAILYFFNKQFAKLAQIANEVENLKDLEDLE